MLHDVVETAETTVQEWLEQNAQYVKSEQIHLDRRCGSIWVCDEAIVCEESNRRLLDYYGGFEYIDSEQIKTIGRYTIYSAGYDDDDRVRVHVNAWTKNR